MVLTCPKVNYKLNYKPGFVLCPRTKTVVAVDAVMDQMKMIASLSIEEKRALPYV